MVLKGKKLQLAQEQVRETMIKNGRLLATRYQEVLASGKDFQVGVAKSGGLTVILDSTDKLRFGACFSPAVFEITAAHVQRWNAANPLNEIQAVSLLRNLEQEAMRTFILLNQLEESIERTQSCES